MLLIITNKEDLTADYFISSLIEKDLPYFRINSEDIQDYIIRFSLTNTHFDAEIQYRNKKIILSEVKAVWYRRAISPIIDQNIDFFQKRFISGELKHLIEGLCMNNDLIWVNPFDAVIKAERKIFQLKIAAEIGFKIPNTLISNDTNLIKSFCRENSSIICKPIYHGYLKAKNKSYAIYCNRIAPKMFDNLNFIYPLYLQEEIDKVMDIRVTVVGNEIFPVKIEFDKTKSPDWRKRECNITYEIIDLPDKIQELCFRLVSKLGLKFGAIDLAKSSKGDYYFFEINPTGEWAWLEYKLGLPIRESLIKLFFNNKK